MGEPSLRVFVATGDERVAEVTCGLVEDVAKRLADRLGRSVEIVVGKDGLGWVDADVYIADLSGADPEVYLELGVRWALRDGITVLISRDAGQGRPLPFNVSANRVLFYGPMPDELERAVDGIVTSVLAAMRDPAWIDSPVRTGVELLTAPRSEWDNLRVQLRRLQELHADELVAAAKDVPPARAIELLRRAIDRNPHSVQAHYHLGVVLSRTADYSGAICELATATELKADFAEAWRELGLALSKSGQLGDAEAAFNQATELAPADAEAWSNLGGLRRRIARAPGGGKPDWVKLRESLSAYQRACEIVGNDTYPLVNVARLDLLLSAHWPGTRQAALASLHRLSHLARFQAETARQPGGDSDQKPWKVLDLADTLLLTGHVDEGLAELREAIDLIDPRNREAILTSVIEPLQDFIDVEVLDAPTAAGVIQAIEICKGAIDVVRPRKPGPRKADG